MKLTALDLGVHTGVAFGHSGQQPQFTTWHLAAPTLAERGQSLFEFLTNHLMHFDPDHVYIEAPLNLAGMAKIGTSTDTIASLYGYSAVAQTVCALRGIEPQLRGVLPTRKHFLGFAPKGKEGKRCVTERCRQLRWTPRDEHQADAAALWDFACAIEDSSAHLRERLRQSVRLSIVQ